MLLHQDLDEVAFGDTVALQVVGRIAAGDQDALELSWPVVTAGTEYATGILVENIVCSTAGKRDPEVELMTILGIKDVDIPRIQYDVIVAVQVPALRTNDFAFGIDIDLIEIVPAEVKPVRCEPCKSPAVIRAIRPHLGHREVGHSFILPARFGNVLDSNDDVAEMHLAVGRAAVENVSRCKHTVHIVLGGAEESVDQRPDKA